MNKFLKLFHLVFLVLFTVCLIASGFSSEAEEKVLTVGVVFPLTGPCARTGEEFKNATEMCFEQIGYKIGDYKVKLVWMDDASDPVKATSVYEKAIQKDKIDCGIGVWNSSCGSALMEINAKYKIPHFFSYAAADIVNEKWASDDKYKYMTTKAWATPTKLSVAYVEAFNEAIDKGVWKPESKTVFMYGEDNDWGRAYATAVGKALKDTGWKIVGEEYYKTGDTDMYALLAKMKSSNAALVAGTGTSTPSIAALVKQAKEVKLKSLLVCDGLGFIGEWYKLTGDASNYVFDSVPIFVTDKAKKFAADFQAKYGIEPSAAAAGQQYDFTRYFIKVCNETLKNYGALNSETLFKFTKEKLWTGQCTFTDGIIQEQYKYDAQSLPDPVVGEGYYIFPVFQYIDGKPKVIWPDSQKETDLMVPEAAK